MKSDTNKTIETLAELGATYIDKDLDIGVCIEVSQDRTWARLKWEKWRIQNRIKEKIIKYGWMPMRLLRKIK